MITLLLDHLGSGLSWPSQFRSNILHFLRQQTQLLCKARVLLFQGFRRDLIVSKLRRKLCQNLLLFLCLHKMNLGLVLICLFLKVQLLVLGEGLSSQNSIKVMSRSRRTILRTASSSS